MYTSINNQTNAALMNLTSSADGFCDSEHTETLPEGGSCGGTHSQADLMEVFTRISGLYAPVALDKVIICIGTGGSRDFLIDLARSGFRNFILIDRDTVSLTNVATQGTYLSEVGRNKTEVIREKILDLNPEAKVVCVNRFLDDSMSDEEFHSYMDMFPGRSGTDYLICGCADNFEGQKRAALLALKYGCPYLASWLYEKGAAAEVIFTYPGVTESCPRCMLRTRFEMYEKGFVSEVTSAGTPIFATSRLNEIKGFVALMLLNYHEEGGGRFSTMLDDVKDRNFIIARLYPQALDEMGFLLFDKILKGNGAERFSYMDETFWVPQKPDSPVYGEPCRMCGGTGDLTFLSRKWANVDTRTITFDRPYKYTEEELASMEEKGLVLKKAS